MFIMMVLCRLGVGFEKFKGDRREISTFLFLSGGSHDEE